MFWQFLLGLFSILMTEIYFTLELEDSLGCGGSLHKQSVLGVKHDLFGLELQFLLVAEVKLLPHGCFFSLCLISLPPLGFPVAGPLLNLSPSSFTSLL